MSRAPASPPAFAPRRVATGLFAAMLAAVAMAGCNGPDELRRTTDMLAECRQQLADSQRQQQDLAEQLEIARRQIVQLQGLGEARLDVLFHVQRVELGRHSGAVDTSGDGVQDSVRAYLQPIDQRGHTIKAAGAITLEVFDLAADASENLLIRRQWTAEEAGGLWHGGFAGNHFTLTVPIERRPAGGELVLRASFVDYLTGREFSVQRNVPVRATAGPARP